MRNNWSTSLVGLGVGLVALGCGGSTAGVVPVGAPGPERVQAVAQDSLRLLAVWSLDVPVPEGSAIRYWVTWSRNGERVGSDTTGEPRRGAVIRRMGRGIPDTVLVTLWTLNHGVPSQRASWRERIYRPASATSDTIDLGPAPPPETRIPRAGAKAEIADSTQPAAEPVSVPAPALPPAQRAADPMAPAPRTALNAPPAQSRAIQRVILRVMDPPPSWSAKGWDRDCPAGIRSEAPLGLMVLPETPERCMPYVTSYGAAPEM